jgi:hypothetical protein
VKELEVKSDFFSGVIFSGTAESIYNEMKALNPDSIGTVAVDEDVSLTKRALQSVSPKLTPHSMYPWITLLPKPLY